MSQSNTSPLTEFRKAKGGISQSTLARMFDPPRNKTTVLRWERDGVPFNRLVEVEAVTGIPRSELRPDMFNVSEASETSE